MSESARDRLFRHLRAARRRHADPGEVGSTVLAARLWRMAHPGDVAIGLALRDVLDAKQPKPVEGA